MRRGLVIAALLAVLAGCGGGQDVDWSNYSPQVQDRIDRLARLADCDGLQQEFDTADANDGPQRDRTGDGNADLMAYIDAKMRGAGCYD